MNCSNCNNEGTIDTSIMVYAAITQAPPTVAICKTCQENVLTLKIVLTREDIDKPFTFDGYLPVASKR